jgi:hypothetical protein
MQKVSGQFKSGAKTFAILHSVIDSCIKRYEDILPTLQEIALLVPAE